MNVLRNVVLALAMVCATVWIMLGDGPLGIGARIGVAFVGLLIIGLIAAAAAARQRRQQLERNQRHCQERGHEFIPQPDLNSVYHEAGLFRHDNARIEQLARVKTRSNVVVDVFDLFYEVTSRNSEGGSSTHTVAQTVASLPFSGLTGVRLTLTPVRGIAGRLVRALGLSATLQASPQSLGGEEELVRWFNGAYVVGGDAATGGREADRILSGVLLEWLRANSCPALELADGHVLLWRPGSLVDALARDELAECCCDAAEVLGQKHTASPAHFALKGPETKSMGGLFFRLALSGIGSWAIACALMFALFFGGVASGLLEKAPLPGMLGIMAITVIAWVAAGALIFSLLAPKE